MKKIIVLMLSIFIFAALFPTVTHAGGDVLINSGNFPDSGFRNLVSDEYDTDGNGALSSEEISKVTKIQVKYYDYDIRSLEGIEHFTELRSLDCEENKLTSLDVSNNSKLEVIWCAGNKNLSVIHLNTNIWELYCYGCNIEALYIANATHLLDAYESGWTNIDFDGSYQFIEYGNPTQKMVICCDQNTGIIAESTTGWKKVNSKWFYIDASERIATGWQKISNKWYYFNSQGMMQTGWQKISNKWYYFNSSGVMQTGWQKISDKWYYFNSSGVMQTGWLKLSGKWYYLKSSGAMQTGWLKLSGKWYYFENSGIMLANTSKTIDGKKYHFNSNGVCTNP